MEDSERESRVTVQGLITPVPAALGSERAGYQSSISSDCNVSPVSLAGVQDKATSNRKDNSMAQVRCEADPFRRSAKIQRSPQRYSLSLNETPKNSEVRQNRTNIGENQKSAQTTKNSGCNSAGASSTTRTMVDTPQNVQTVLEDTAYNYNSPRQEFILKMRLSEEETIENCQKVLRKMRQAMTRQKNISKDVQSGVSELEELLDVMKDYRRNWKDAEKERGSCRQILETKRLAIKASGEKPNQSLRQAKRNASSPAEDNPGKKPKGLRVKEGQEIPRNQHEAPADEKSPIKENNFIEKHRARKIKMRPNAVIIRPNEGLSYADVLRNIKSKIRPEETEVAVRGIRRTMGGSILLEMEKGGDLDKFRDSIKHILKGEAEVRDLKQRATLEIRDLDSLTTEEEVIAAISRATQSTKEDLSVRLTETNILEQRRAFVSLPLNKTKEVLKTARIKIGWTNCRIRLREETKNCYRCFGTGHLQRECKGIDRRGMGLCIKCGEKGHKRKECKNPARCCICIEAGESHVNHLPGTRSCKTREKSMR